MVRFLFLSICVGLLSCASAEEYTHQNDVDMTQLEQPVLNLIELTRDRHELDGKRIIVKGFIKYDDEFYKGKDRHFKLSPCKQAVSGEYYVEGSSVEWSYSSLWIPKNELPNFFRKYKRLQKNGLSRKIILSGMFKDGYTGSFAIGGGWEDNQGQYNGPLTDVEVLTVLDEYCTRPTTNRRAD